MNNAWKFFLTITLMSLFVQALCAMFEMASVSFNKVRLQYYVSKQSIRARWLSDLVRHPGQLFGTTLIGLNTAMQIGSESARRFYESLGLNPDWAPLTQIVLVMIFSELTPMFAGRKYPEHVALLLVPLFYVLSKILSPLIWFFNAMCRFVNFLFRLPGVGPLYLSREELQNIIEQIDESKKEFNTAIGNIFSLKMKKAKELMTPLNDVQMIPSFCTISELRRLLQAHYSAFLPIYHKYPHHIVGIARPRDLLRFSDHELVRTHSRSAWFITENSPVTQILKQFRSNNQSMAVVLNKAGVATGVLTLEGIIDAIFGREETRAAFEDSKQERAIYVERTFPAERLVSTFNAEFRANLPVDEGQTLGELMAKALGHLPTEGESVRMGHFEFEVTEATLLGAKTILIRSQS